MPDLQEHEDNTARLAIVTNMTGPSLLEHINSTSVQSGFAITS